MLARSLARSLSLARSSGSRSSRRFCVWKLVSCASSLALEHAGAPLATCACLAVAVIHSSYGANVTAFVFSHAGGGHVRLSTLAIMWATGAVAFAGTSPFICEALRQAARGSALAPSAYLSACAAISLGALRLAPSGMLRGDHAEAEAEPDPEGEGEGEGEAQAGLRSTTSSSRGLPREYTHADTAL